MTTSFLSEFFPVAIAHLLAVASPGPDFAVVLQHSLTRPFKIVRWTCAGIACGILVHVSYAALGLATLMQSQPIVYEIVLIAGALFLLRLGYLGVRSGPAPVPEIVQAHAVPAPVAPSAFAPDPGEPEAAWRAFRAGFLTNVLNPKATLFFLSLFALVVSPGVSPLALGLLALWLSLATGLWFLMIARLAGHRVIRTRLQTKAWIIDRLMGSVLILLGVKLLWEQFV